MAKPGQIKPKTTTLEAKQTATGVWEIPPTTVAPQDTKPVRQRRKRREVLTDKMVAALERKPQPYFHPDPELPKFGIRVRQNGPASYYIITRDKVFKKQKWVKVGSTAEMNIESARAVAREVIRRVERGDTPFEPPPVKPDEPDSVETIAADWIELHVEKKKLRTADEIERVVTRYVLPYWAKRAFASITRRDVTDLLNAVERKHGPHVADSVATVLRSIDTWQVDEGYAAKDYVSPFAKIKRRVLEEDRKRARVLTAAELRAVWKAAGDAGAFGKLIKLLLLTAQRREIVLTMCRSDISASNVWTIPKTPGGKGTPDTLLLPDVAVKIIDSMPRFIDNKTGASYVFAVNHKGFNSRIKKAFDDACGVRGWRLHDLRRTARSLMSKAGVRPDVAELCLGHVVGGVKETYDRYDYASEMADALRRLVALISIILAGKFDTDHPDQTAALRAEIDRMVVAPSKVTRLRSRRAAS
jgi:integrase